MRTEKDIRAEIDNIIRLEKENIEEMMEIINEGYGDLRSRIDRVNEYAHMRTALEWVLSDDE